MALASGYAALVVEDDPALRYLVTITLADEGFEVLAAPDGKQALDLQETHDVDVIVLDLQLPVMDGRTFFREIRSRGVSTPVLILSAHEPRLAQRELGAEAAMDKPFDADALVGVVLRLAREARRASAADGDGSRSTDARERPGNAVPIATAPLRGRYTDSVRDAFRSLTHGSGDQPAASQPSPRSTQR